MKFTFCFVICLISFSVNAQTWMQMSNFPGAARDDGSCFVIDDVAYCGTGVVSWFATQRDFYAFDMDIESWQPIASLPIGRERQYASGFSSDGFGYIATGISNGKFLNDLWQYDPINGNWIEKSPLPDSGRSGAASFVIDSIAYLVGGKNDSTAALNEVWAYDFANDSWTSMNPLPFGGSWRASAISNDSLAYLIFGLDENLNYHNVLFEYNPQSDSWKNISEFPAGERNYSSLNYMNGKLIVFAGMDSLGNFLNDIWSYDVKNNSWAELDSLPSKGRRGGMSFTDGRSIYYTTGISDNHIRLTETWKAANITSLTEISPQVKFSLYPNPAQSKVILEVPSEFVQKGEFLIFDSMGSLLQKKKIEGLRTDINISYLSTGIYFVLFRDENEHYMSKLVKW